MVSVLRKIQITNNFEQLTKASRKFIAQNPCIMTCIYNTVVQYICYQHNARSQANSLKLRCGWHVNRFDGFETHSNETMMSDQFMRQLKEIASSICILVRMERIEKNFCLQLRF